MSRGSLPAALHIANNNIVGNVTSPPGNFEYTLRVGSGEQSKSLSCSLTVNPPRLRLTSGCPASSATQNAAYGPFTLTATGGTSSYTYSVVEGNLPAGVSLTGNVISGTPTSPGSSSFKLRVSNGTDVATGEVCSVNVVPAELRISGLCPLPAAAAGTAFSTSLTVTGGRPEYRYVLQGPSWLTVEPSATGATLSGTPTETGSFPIAVTVTDAAQSTARYSCSLTVGEPPLEITATCPGPSVQLPAAISMPLTGSGGRQPYSWSLVGPDWLTLSANTGASVAASGSPKTGGNFAFTVKLSDNAGTTPVSKSCVLAAIMPSVPPPTITGFTAPSGSAMQLLPLGVELPSPSPVPLEGELLLTFTPSAPGITGDYGLVHFNITGSGDGTRYTFSIPADGTAPEIPIPDVTEGNVAGTIRVELVRLETGGVDVLPANPPFSEIDIPAAAPVITDLHFENERTDGFDIVIEGYSTPRDITSATLRFNPSQDASIDGNAEFTLGNEIQSVFSQFYQDSRSVPGGSSFHLVIPVNLNGDKGAVGGVTVTLTNSAGTSASATASR